VVGRDTDGLTDRRDARRPVPRGTCVLESGFRIFFKQIAGHDEVFGHIVRGRLVEGRQFTTDLRRQLLGFDVVGQPGTGRAIRRFVTGLRRPAVPL